jgi:hypothetical protein
MRIVFSPEPQPEPEDFQPTASPVVPPIPIQVPVTPAPAVANDPGLDVVLDKALGEFRELILADLQKVLARYDTPQARNADELKANAQAMQLLAGEVGTLRENLLKAQAARTQADSLAQDNVRTLAALTEEIAALRKALIELKAERHEAPRTPRKDPPGVISFEEPALPIQPTTTLPPAQPEPHILFDALAPSTVVTTEKPKVAFLNKLWDYLNQVAFEIPLRKSDRNG